MASYIKKSLATMAGYGNPDLLPPAEYLSVQASNSDSDEDCTGCANPCTEHKEYPSYLNIDIDFPMLGSVKPYGRHVLIATGASDWPKKIQHEKDTFAYSLYNAESKSKSRPWKNLVTNSSMTSTYSTLEGACDVLIFPDNIIVSNVTSEMAGDFYALFLATPLPTAPIDIEFMMRDDRMGEMQIHKSPYKSMLLLCSHRKRDKRCGITAPILAQELDHVLREKDLSEHDAAVVMVSHIGGKKKSFVYNYGTKNSCYLGHQLAGNVICYTNEGTRGIWYGRVKTCHCRAIIEETIINGKVIKDLYRGSMDNSFENHLKKSSFLKW
jgi:(2Fe-2S) ferredoxin